jgi:hypothetical protein
MFGSSPNPSSIDSPDSGAISRYLSSNNPATKISLGSYISNNIRQSTPQVMGTQSAGQVADQFVPQLQAQSPSAANNTSLSNLLSANSPQPSNDAILSYLNQAPEHGHPSIGSIGSSQPQTPIGKLVREHHERMASRPTAQRMSSRPVGGFDTGKSRVGSGGSLGPRLRLS